MPTATMTPEVKSAMKQKANDWKMPEVTITTDVLWYPYADIKNRPIRAVVTQVHDNSVQVELLGKGLASRKHAVRHITDPHLRIYTNAAAVDGAWDFTDQVKDLMQMQEALAEALEKIDALEAEVYDKPRTPVTSPKARQVRPEKEKPEEEKEPASYTIEGEAPTVMFDSDPTDTNDITRLRQACDELGIKYEKHYNQATLKARIRNKLRQGS